MEAIMEATTAATWWCRILLMTLTVAPHQAWCSRCRCDRAHIHRVHMGPRVHMGLSVHMGLRDHMGLSVVVCTQGWCMAQGARAKSTHPISQWSSILPTLTHHPSTLVVSATKRYQYALCCTFWDHTFFENIFSTILVRLAFWRLLMLVFKLEH